MTKASRLLCALLGVGVLSIWVEERWAWALLQIGVFVIAAWRVLARRAFSLPRELLLLAAAALWPLLQLALGTTVNRAATGTAVLDWFTFLLIFALAQDLWGDRAECQWCLRAVAIFGSALAGAAVLGKYSAPGRIFWLFDSGFRSDVMGPFVNRNQYCAWIELLLPVSLYLAATDARLRALFGTAAAVMAGSVVASASRAGIALVSIEILAVGLVLAARLGRSPRKQALAAAQFLMLAGIAVYVGGWQEAAARLHSSAPEPLRLDALRASGQMVQDKPFAGSGLGTWSTVYPRFASIDNGVFLNQAHNDWVQWAAEGGLPFALLIFFFAALLCRPAIQSIYGIGMAVFLLHALVDYPMQQRPALAAWFFGIAGLACAWRKGRAPSHDGPL